MVLILVVVFNSSSLFMNKGKLFETTLSSLGGVLFFFFLSILLSLPLVIVRSEAADHSWASCEHGVVLEVTLELLL